MIQCKFFTPDEFRAQEDARRAAIEARRAELRIVDWNDELAALSTSFFPPGSMWFTPWYHDPMDPGDVGKIDGTIARMRAEPNKHWHLSIHYWTTWARIRPPIEVVCPGGIGWCVDAKSNNGDGWVVTGEAPNLICNPSIWTGQGQGKPREYHGWLGTNGAPPGWFSNPL
jgi:hypothetical protein